MLMPLLAQNGRMPLDYASNDAVREVLAEHFAQVDITDENKDALLLGCASLGLASSVCAALEAGANAAHIDEVRVRDSRGVARE